MSRIASLFQKPRVALIPYLTVGYPSVEVTMGLVPMLEEAGADLVELGIPFSDPLADGATIQHSSQRALEHGVTPSLCLEVAAKLRKRVQLPMVFMTYYNPILSYGQEAFCRASAEAGIDGLIITDLPPEEGEELEGFASGQGIDVIYLLAPTSPPERIDLVVRRSRGFIYLVSLTGVTGARNSLPPELEEFVQRVRGRASQPLCVGFGIASPQQAGRVARVADGVIVGSRFIQLLDKSLSEVRSFTESLRQALDQVQK